MLFYVSLLVVMQPRTIINQTLYSYCKEQYDFNMQSSFLNLTMYVILFCSFLKFLFIYLNIFIPLDGHQVLFMRAVHIRSQVRELNIDLNKI